MVKFPSIETTMERQKVELEKRLPKWKKLQQGVHPECEYIILSPS